MLGLATPPSHDQGEEANWSCREPGIRNTARAVCTGRVGDWSKIILGLVPGSKEIAGMADDHLPQKELIALLSSLRARVAALESELAAARGIDKQLQESEEKFRQVTNTIDEVFWLTDPRKNSMLFISPAYERIWGLSCQSLLNDPMSFIESIHPQDRDAVIAAFPQQKAGTYDIEYRIIRSDGEVRWIRDKAFPIRNTSGDVYRVVGVAQDITENKNLIRELNLEKERTEHLLENILPKSIICAQKGQANLPLQTLEAPVIAQRIDHATVLFADLVGFTAFSATRQAEYVVQQLNYIVNVFDRLSEKYGVEKIKTIGDCYMMAGGVPDRQDDHDLRVANAALEMRIALAHINSEQGENFEIRIGIHSGPLVAGVIGTTKFVYDLWGDTVNMASRMESAGVPGEIQVSESTYRLLKDRFRFEDRGNIALKGKDQVPAYLLKGPA